MRSGGVLQFMVMTIDHTFTRRQAFTRGMDTIVSEDDEETTTRLRERWRFDQDDEPTIGPEGDDEQDRVLIDDYDPKYLRHMMTLLSDTDHQALSTDNTLVVSVDGRHRTVSPYRLGAQLQYVRRDQRGVQQVYPGSMPLFATRAVPAGVPMPNGVLISMQAHVKAMHYATAVYYPLNAHFVERRHPSSCCQDYYIPKYPHRDSAVLPYSRDLYEQGQWKSHWRPCARWRLGQADCRTH